MKYFWSDWKKLSKLEETGVRSILAAKKIILTNISKEDIVGIFVKGSFVRREMNKYSDVDLVVVLKTAKHLLRIGDLSRKYRDNYLPPIQIAAYSVWELRNARRVKNKKRAGANPSRTCEHLKHYELIYGKRPFSKDFSSGNHKERLGGMIGVFKNSFLPLYKKGKMHRHELIKQVFWLVENEQKCLGRRVPHRWRLIAKSIKNKNHIIHDAKRLYFDTKKTENKMRKFITKLERYINRLEVERGV